MSSWVLGYPDRAVRHMDEALALAETLAHPVSGAQALLMSAGVRHFRREPEEALRLADAGIALCAEHGIVRWVARMRVLRGRVLVELGGDSEAVAEFGVSIQVLLDDGGSKYLQPWFFVFQAEVDLNAGQAFDGLGKIANGNAHAERTGDHWVDAELHRVSGELLLTDSGRYKEEAEAEFQEAIEIARSQAAKSLELRAATSLARLWNDESKPTEARDLLAPIYGWFTEGFDTADLKEAKALLDELH